MATERFNGCPINLETLTETEARTLQGYIGERLLQAQGEWLQLDEVIGRRWPTEPEVV